MPFCHSFQWPFHTILTFFKWILVLLILSSLSVDLFATFLFITVAASLWFILPFLPLFELSATYLPISRDLPPISQSFYSTFNAFQAFPQLFWDLFWAPASLFLCLSSLFVTSLKLIYSSPEICHQPLFHLLHFQGFSSLSLAFMRLMLSSCCWALCCLRCLFGFQPFLWPFWTLLIHFQKPASEPSATDSILIWPFNPFSDISETYICMTKAVQKLAPELSAAYSFF